MGTTFAIIVGLIVLALIGGKKLTDTPVASKKDDYSGALSILMEAEPPYHEMWRHLKALLRAIDENIRPQSEREQVIAIKNIFLFRKALDPTITFQFVDEWVNSEKHDLRQLPFVTQEVEDSMRLLGVTVESFITRVLVAWLRDIAPNKCRVPGCSGQLKRGRGKCNVCGSIFTPS